MQVRVFVVAEEVEFIFHDRPAQIESKTIVIVGGLAWDRIGRDCLFGEVIYRIEISVLEVLVCGTVETVGSGLGHKIELASGGMTGFGAELIGL